MTKQKQESDKCECLELRRLFKLRGEAEDLEAKCEIMKASIDLENFVQDKIPIEEITRALTYYVESGHFQEAVTTYWTEIGKLVNAGNLKMKRQNDDLGLYCSHCGQYVDEMSSILMLGEIIL